jgi:hypothetical protein
MTPNLTKKCQLCDLDGFYCYKPLVENNVHCTVCQNSTCVEFHFHNGYHYNYCNHCKIIFRYNDSNEHHNLCSFGCLYNSEIICKFTSFGNSFDYCPIFDGFDEDKRKDFVELYEKGDIKIEWMKYFHTEECCVCFETTNHKTECRHPVCSECLKSLYKCPLCRYDLFYKYETTPEIEIEISNPIISETEFYINIVSNIIPEEEQQELETLD